MNTEYHQAAKDLTFEDCWEAFKDMRRKKKKPMTELAEKIQINRLKNLSDIELEQKAMLLQSADRYWDKVYEVKPEIKPTDDW